VTSGWVVGAPRELPLAQRFRSVLGVALTCVGVNPNLLLKLPAFAYC
jgi:hypothetical protein